jgi:hypothetical protein
MNLLQESTVYLLRSVACVFICRNAGAHILLLSDYMLIAKLASVVETVRYGRYNIDMQITNLLCEQGQPMLHHCHGKRLHVAQ